MGLQYSKNSSRINMPPITDDEVITQEEVTEETTPEAETTEETTEETIRSQRIKAFECTDQRVKSKTSWCSYLLYNRKISDTLKIKIEKALIHSIPKNLLPSRIFKNVQMTKPPDFLD